MLNKMKHQEIWQKRLRYHELQASSDFDISIGVKPTQKYCIASTPRSGSTLISKMLGVTGLAGDPREYLNPLLMQAWCRINEKPLFLNSYLEELHSRKTSKNGMFGIKIHWRHLEKLSEKKIPLKNIQLIINDFDRFIFISRKDKISQAISYYIANSTGIFHSDQEEWLNEFEVPEPVFNAEKILKHLSDIVREEDGWNTFFKHIKKPVLRVYYEDLIADYETNSNEIISFLGIPPTDIPIRPTKEMKKGYSTKYKDLLLQTIGLKEANLK
jgi:LPS sulfotransferase NodH